MEISKTLSILDSWTNCIFSLQRGKEALMLNVDLLRCVIIILHDVSLCACISRFRYPERREPYPPVESVRITHNLI